MLHASVAEFIRAEPQALAKGPIAIVFIEDDAAVARTLDHCLTSGFRVVLAFSARGPEAAEEDNPNIHWIKWAKTAEAAMSSAVNAVIAAAPGQWIHYCYNAEFLMFPFCESRSVAEMIAFNVEERRDTVLTYVIDLYASDLHRHPDAVDLDGAFMDRSGYYALARTDRWNNTLDRQMDFFGGLRWRFEEHVPKPRRRIDRVSIFKAKKGLLLSEDHTFNDAEYNTYACPWHHNLTAAVCSFRTAKALKRNPGSTYAIDTFRWHNSVPFEWKSEQLMNLGLMEPGQWF
ncbi:MAG: hypothetical protein AAFO93_00805 [Pseudomonadota bacterium]